MAEVKVGQVWQYGTQQGPQHGNHYAVLKVVEPFCKVVMVKPMPKMPKPFMVKTSSLNGFYTLVEGAE